MNEKKRNVIPEICVFVFYIFLCVLMFCLHELWFDEIQAYMIAKDASYHDILFFIPHFEGHPPFYYLLLSILAKTNVSIDIGLRVLTFPFSIVATFFVIFKAPFKRIYRLLIPFTYYLFFQYSVNCRPYAIMYLGFVLVAYFYNTRNDHPIRYIFSLILLCASHAYGIIFAGCFCVIWTFEIIFELKGKKFINRALKDKRFWCLCSILLFALLEVSLIFPDKTSIATTLGKDASIFSCFIYTFFEMLSDSIMTDTGFYGRLQIEGVDVFALSSLPSLAFTIIFLICICYVTYKKKKLIIFLLPYICFNIYATFGYISEHHIGIMNLFLLFVMWVSFDEKEKEYLSKENIIDNKYSKIFFSLALIPFIINITWSIFSCVNDIKTNLWYAKDFSKFANDYELDKYKVMDSWLIYKLDNNFDYDLTTLYGEIDVSRVKHNSLSVSHPDVLAYSDSNYFMNLNNGEQNKRYVLNKCLSDNESNDYINSILKNEGRPDFVVGSNLILKFTSLGDESKNYVPVARFDYFIPNKMACDKYSFYVYAYKDIYYSRNDWPLLKDQNRSEKDR